jgi:ubiquinone/menaquinone biosynthesis C-methylase UbiE
MEAPWWQRAFRADYLQLYAHRDVASAREEVAYLAARGWLGQRVLDLCCGQGRHSLALAERGHAVQGLDWSQDLLDRASLLDTTGLLRGRLRQGDARSLPYAERSFDTVVQLFTSFGYFDRQGDLTVLAEVARVLDGDGLWVLDLINPALLRRTLVPHSVRTHEGIQIEETRALVEEGQAVRKDIRYTDPAGREQQWTEQVRLWTAEELIEPARRAGLTLEARVGGFRGEPWGPDAPRQLLVWRKDAP